MKRSHSHTPSEDTGSAPPAARNPVPQGTTSGYDWFHSRVPSGDHRLVAIGLGTNLGSRLETVRSAARTLRLLLEQPLFSSIYQTAPMYVTDQPSFLNACCVGWTDLDPEALLAHLKGLERAAGRQPNTLRFGPRVLDLDIVLYANEVLESEQLTIPHPRLSERAFVLLPLSEIAGSWIHPVSGVSIQELAASVDSTGAEATNLQLE